ncbi:zinc finger C2H2 domain-containing protein [Candidatus Nitrososphaera gargensis Ga9.2]|uniref:Zinc finger C2H2 domain-containing protein n=1 Tax=Nitrososphaera gargensis (strain Ga9.2) TaxID=1237085 RepID=K0IM55_NITGG|nr:zinc finger C2H2 domain-containing protein [Candidatus Nitrososphaera gargensis Ga9.2]
MSKESFAEYRCRSCGQQFSSLGDMQKHILIEHFQTGDIPAKEDAQREAQAA